MKKFVTTFLITSILAVSGVTVASAAIVNIGGGIWNYGVDKNYVWSNYYHGYKKHSSTAVGKYTSYSGPTGAGYNAYASAPKKLFGNKSYYNVW